jgi:hypothetical protein
MQDKILLGTLVDKWAAINLLPPCWKTVIHKSDCIIYSPSHFQDGNIPLISLNLSHTSRSIKFGDAPTGQTFVKIENQYVGAECIINKHVIVLVISGTVTHFYTNVFAHEKRLHSAAETKDSAQNK